MRLLCLTIDVDRDVNFSISNKVDAGSLDRGKGTNSRFKSTERGLELISEMLDDLGITATFFVEGRIAETMEIYNYMSGHEIGMHGYDHEDLTGKSNNVTYEEGEILSILEKSSNAIYDFSGKKSECFRAPYMAINTEILEMLPQIGIKYDSSTYTSMTNSLMPSRLKNGIWEIPVPESVDGFGKKISAFLWPMHERKRKYTEYIEMADKMDEGIFTLATHTWHMVESTSNEMSKEEISDNMDNIKKVLEGILDLGYKEKTIPCAVHSL